MLRFSVGVGVEVFLEMGKEVGAWLCHAINFVGLGRSHEVLELYSEEMIRQ